MTTTARPAMLRLDLIDPHPANIRDGLGDTDDLDQLARSIREHGILQPLVVTPTPEGDRYLLLAGHRRAAAAARAGLTTVPAVIRTGPEVEANRAGQLALMLVENLHRADLGPVEKAQAFGALHNQGMTTGEIARIAAVSPSLVSYYLRLLDLDEESLQLVIDGEIPLGEAHAAVVRARREQRTRHGARDRGRPAVVEPPHFTGRHPLAGTVRASCEHPRRPKVGGIGCGQCWEQAIRADAAGEAEILGPQPSPSREVDEAKVHRAVCGERLNLTIAERAEAVRRLCGHGLSDGDIAARLHISPRTVLRARERLGLPANVDAGRNPITERTTA